MLSSCRIQFVLLKILQYVIGNNLMFNFFYMLSEMAAMKFHIIFVGQAVAHKHATILIVTVSPYGIVAIQNVRVVNLVVGILLVVKTVSATIVLMYLVGSAGLPFYGKFFTTSVLIVQQLSLSLLMFSMAMTVPMLVLALVIPISAR